MSLQERDLRPHPLEPLNRGVVIPFPQRSRVALLTETPEIIKQVVFEPPQPTIEVAPAKLIEQQTQKNEVMQFRGRIGALVSHHKACLARYVTNEGQVSYDLLVADPQFQEDKYQKLFSQMRVQQFGFKKDSKMVKEVEKQDKVIEGLDRNTRSPGEPTPGSIAWRRDGGSAIRDGTTFKTGGPPRGPDYHDGDFAYRMRHLVIAAAGIIGIVGVVFLADHYPPLKENWYPFGWGKSNSSVSGSEQNAQATARTAAELTPAAKPAAQAQSSPAAAQTALAVENLTTTSAVWSDQEKTMWLGPNLDIGIKLDTPPATRQARANINGQARPVNMVTNAGGEIRSRYGQREYKFADADVRLGQILDGKISYEEAVARSSLKGWAEGGDCSFLFDSPQFPQCDPYEADQLARFESLRSQDPKMNAARVGVLERVFTFLNQGKVENPDNLETATIPHGGKYTIGARGEIRGHQGDLNTFQLPGRSIREQSQIAAAVVTR